MRISVSLLIVIAIASGALLGKIITEKLLPGSLSWIDGLYNLMK